MTLMETIIEKAKSKPQIVGFPEGEDETMMRAAAKVAAEGIAHPVLVGDEEQLRALAKERGIDPETFGYSNTTGAENDDELCERYLAYPGCALKEKGVRRRLGRPLERALILQAVGETDITFAGILSTTGEVIAAGQQYVGLGDGVETISSVGVFDIPGYEGENGTLLAFGDSAVCADPTEEQLASIAISCCDTIHDLCGWEPKCALLSYSTCGSGASALVDKVVHARDIAKEKRPDLAIDGEFQLDSAINPRVAERKVKRESDVAGHANIIIWPDLNVGNIGVKLVQQFAGANAYGPMLQGFKKIVCDCSRGAGVDEIAGNVAMSCVRAAALKDGE